ncbi:MAG: hypothetical protein AAB699_00800 [Patescibacteria group bacterium]
MNEELKKKVIRAAIQEKKPLKEIAKALFITDKQLLLLFKNWGVQLPRRQRKVVERPDRNSLMVLYRKEGNVTKVARTYEVSANTVLRWMRELNLPTRRMKLSEDEKISILEKHLQELHNVSL